MPNTNILASGMFEAGHGVSLHYDVSGNCDGQRRLLLLHGFGASTEDWSDVRGQLEEGACVVALDLKGHGQSSRPKDGDYSLDTQAELLLRFLSERCPGDTVLVGHSYGGAVALLATVKAKERGEALPVSALVLVDVPAYPQAAPMFLRVLYMPVLRNLVSLVPAHVAVKYSLKKSFYDRKKLTHQIIDRYVAGMKTSGSHYAFGLAAKQIFPVDLEGYLIGLRKITLPVLILWGANDRIVRPEVATRLNRDIAGSSLSVIQNCGHVPQEEKPSEFLAALKPFLKTVPYSPNGRVGRGEQEGSR